jgi:hypothetical protein
MEWSLHALLGPGNYFDTFFFLLKDKQRLGNFMGENFLPLFTPQN